MPTPQSYVSNDLSHFAGRDLPDDESRLQLLVNILKSGWLLTRPHLSPLYNGNLTVDRSVAPSSNKMYAPEILCFCDIPVKQLAVHTAKYGRFGLALGKDFVAQKGGAPVFYRPLGTVVRGNSMIGQSQGPLGAMFDRMVPEYHSLVDSLLQSRRQGLGLDPFGLLYLSRFFDEQVFSYVKFFDASLADDDPNNYYMEREWRVLGNVRFELGDVKRVFVPPKYSDRLRAEVPEYLGEIELLG